jgi:hypothetical protein
MEIFNLKNFEMFEFRRFFTKISVQKNLGIK